VTLIEALRRVVVRRVICLNQIVHERMEIKTHYLLDTRSIRLRPPGLTEFSHHSVDIW
jgi:hypothetical protein